MCSYIYKSYTKNVWSESLNHHGHMTLGSIADNHEYSVLVLYQSWHDVCVLLSSLLITYRTHFFMPINVNHCNTVAMLAEIVHRHISKLRPKPDQTARIQSRLRERARFAILVNSINTSTCMFPTSSMYKIYNCCDEMRKVLSTARHENTHTHTNPLIHVRWMFVL